MEVEYAKHPNNADCTGSGPCNHLSSPCKLWCQYTFASECVADGLAQCSITIWGGHCYESTCMGAQPVDEVGPDEWVVYTWKYDPLCWTK
jgi:hypothetical protein